jgi:hypothetical protein
LFSPGSLLVPSGVSSAGDGVAAVELSSEQAGPRIEIQISASQALFMSFSEKILIFYQPSSLTKGGVDTLSSLVSRGLRWLLFSTTETFVDKMYL